MVSLQFNTYTFQFEEVGTRDGEAPQQFIYV